MNIREAAAQRDAVWRAAHPGEPEYQNVDLVAETSQEMVDGWNYLQAKIRRGVPLDIERLLKGCLNEIEGVWEILQWVQEQRPQGGRTG